MPKRPRSHQLEDISRNRLHRKFEEVGWTVEDLAKDYGEDLFVRIFHKGKSTPFSFFVQAKATDDLAKHLVRNTRNIYYRVATEHLIHWGAFREPVILTLYDAKADITYWTCIQNALARLPKTRDLTKHKTLRIEICTADAIDANGLRRIREIAQHRHFSAKREADGAAVLAKILQAKLGLQIDYSPNGTVLVWETRGEGELILFGEIGERLNHFCRKTGASPQAVFDNAMDWVHKSVRQYEKTGKFPVHNKESGKIELRRFSHQQLTDYLLTELER